VNDNKNIRVTVTDTGRGMTSDQIKIIFDPVYTNKEAGKGTGLGLSVSLSSVRSMDGSNYGSDGYSIRHPADYGTIDSAMECTKSGAFSFLQKPCNLDDLLEALKEAYKRKVMNRKKIEEKKTDELLKISISDSPREILRRLREIDKEAE
jgi:response regulator of citrate/malate metabolism